MSVRTVHILTGWSDQGVLVESVIVQDDRLGQLYDAECRMIRQHPTVRLYAAGCCADSPQIYAADLDHLQRTVKAVTGQPYNVAHPILSNRIEATVLGRDETLPTPTPAPYGLAYPEAAQLIRFAVEVLAEVSSSGDDHTVANYSDTFQAYTDDSLEALAREVKAWMHW